MMNDKEFDYYYSNEADQFSFIRLPKILLLDKSFSKLSIEAKVLYGLLLDRMGLSMKNRWVDEKNRVYIIYAINDIQENLGFSYKKAMNSLKELRDWGLVDKKKRGLGLTDLIYVKKFLRRQAVMNEGINNKVNEVVVEPVDDAFRQMEDIGKGTSRSVEIGIARSVETGTSRSVETGTSRSAKMELQEVPNWTPHKNNNKKNNIYVNNTESNHIISQEGEMIRNDKYEKLKEEIRENTELDLLLQRYPEESDLLEGMYDLIVETLLIKKGEILIAKEMLPIAMVHDRYWRLRAHHIENILECLEENTTDIKNIKQYLRTALFNAPSTIGGYIKTTINYEKAQYEQREAEQY